MKIVNFIKTGAFLFIFFALISCSEDGEQGLQGEQGIQGEQGPQGEQGEQGAQGEPGTVNVLYSEWMDQDWNFIDSTTFKSMIVYNDDINDDFLDKGGIILGFFRFQDNVPYQLPYQDFLRNNIRGFSSVHFSDGGGNVRFSIQSTDGTTLTDDEVNGTGASINAQYKYVMIPGGSPITGKSAIQWEQLSYKEVCEALNIPE